MDYKTINLKEFMPSVEQALVQMELEIEVARLEAVKAVKFIHGYGSNGYGGAICFAVRKRLECMKKQRIIKDFFVGEEWGISNAKCFKRLTSIQDCYNDEDLNKQNPGITVVIV